MPCLTSQADALAAFQGLSQAGSGPLTAERLGTFVNETFGEAGRCARLTDCCMLGPVCITSASRPLQCLSHLPFQGQALRAAEREPAAQRPGSLHAAGLPARAEQLAAARERPGHQAVVSGRARPVGLPVPRRAPRWLPDPATQPRANALLRDGKGVQATDRHGCCAHGRLMQGPCSWPPSVAAAILSGPHLRSFRGCSAGSLAGACVPSCPAATLELAAGLQENGSVAAQPDQHSLLTLAHPGVLAGDRFREVIIPAACRPSGGTWLGWLSLATGLHQLSWSCSACPWRPHPAAGCMRHPAAGRAWAGIPSSMPDRAVPADILLGLLLDRDWAAGLGHDRDCRGAPSCVKARAPPTQLSRADRTSPLLPAPLLHGCACTPAATQAWHAAAACTAAYLSATLSWHAVLAVLVKRDCGPPQHEAPGPGTDTIAPQAAPADWHAAAQSVVCNLVQLLQEYGHIPNGARTYYINRRRAAPACQVQLLHARHPCRPASPARAQESVSG